MRSIEWGSRVATMSVGVEDIRLGRWAMLLEGLSLRLRIGSAIEAAVFLSQA